MRDVMNSAVPGFHHQRRMSTSNPQRWQALARPTLPRTDSSLLVRTDFASDDAWQRLSDEAQRENKDGFRAYIETVSDPAFDAAGWEAIRAAVRSRTMARRCCSSQRT